MTQVNPQEMSMSEGVYFTNLTFGNVTLDPTKGPEAYWAKLTKQAAITREEVGEAINGFNTKNITELRDGLCDTLVTAYGLDHIGGLGIGELTLPEIEDGAVQPEDAIRTMEFAMSSIEKCVEAWNIVELTIHTSALILSAKMCSKLVEIDIEADMKAVLASNLSKVSKTQGDAIITQTYYRESVGINTRIEDCPTMPGFIVKVAGNQTGKDGKNYPDGKFLKCRVGFRTPDFS